LSITSAFFAAVKPEWFNVTDCAVVTCLLMASGDKPIKIAHLTIAQRVGTSTDSVKRSLTKLREAEWIVARSGKRSANANTYQVQIANLPLGELKKLVITDDALALADKYVLLIRQRHGKVTAKKSGRAYDRRLPKGWRNRWARIIQKHLTAGNSPEYLLRMFDFASTNFPKKFVRGPQTWSREIPKPNFVAPGRKADGK
jgi:hypothetical protein